MNLTKFYKLTAILFTSITLLNSCIEIKGLKSGYEKNKDLLEVEFVDDLSSSENLDKSKIYAINAETLQKELRKYEKALVYSWSPFCSSDVCISPRFLQEYCDKNDIELFVKIDYYDAAINDFTETTKHPFLIADHFYYKTNFANKYNNRFISDITDRPYKRKDDTFWNRFLFFENGVFTKSVNKVL